MLFENYKIVKHHPQYHNTGIMSRLCKNCGYPYGKHYGLDIVTCPNSILPTSIDPIFYPGSINPNIKVL